MPEQLPQVSKLAGVLVEHQREFESLSTDERQWVIQNPKAAIALFAEAVKNRTATVVKKILTLVTTVKVAAVKRFVAAEKFREGETTDGVKIAWLGGNFKTNFLGKIEDGVEAAELKVHKLNQDSLDTPIITELGEGFETTLAHLWELLKRQSSDKKGKLLVNGYANIFYVRNANGELWAVRARWDADYGGWAVGAYSVAGPGRWAAGRQVLSR